MPTPWSQPIAAVFGSLIVGGNLLPVQTASAQTALANVQGSCSYGTLLHQEFCIGNMFVSDPVGAKATFTRRSVTFDRLEVINLEGRSDPGHLGVHAFSWLEPPYAGGQSYITTRVQASHTEAFAVRSTSSAGTLSTVNLLGEADFHIWADQAFEGSEFQSQYSLEIGWATTLYSYGPGFQLIDSIKMGSSFMADQSLGSFVMDGVLRDSEQLRVASGGMISMSTYMVAQTRVSATDIGRLDDIYRVAVEVSSLNSLRLYADATDQRFSLASASGHAYAAPVPELPAWSLLMLGLGFMLRARRTGRLVQQPTTGAVAHTDQRPA